MLRWKRVSASKNLAVQAIANELDLSEFFCTSPIKAIRVADFSCLLPATGNRGLGTAARDHDGRRPPA